MHDPRDIEATKILRRELIKHYIDSTYADVRVAHGVATIRGPLSLMPGGSGSCRDAVEKVAHHIRGLGTIREVIIDASYRDL
jgi:hypothetical protein